MTLPPAPPRFASLPRAWALGVAVPVATSFRARLLGLALLSRERAGPGLLLPRCRAVHTFGMRFPIDVVFLDRGGAEIRRVRLEPMRLARERLAASVLELPGGADRGGGV
jgi:uncharacterized membrane protein (UPF0127 family)